MPRVFFAPTAVLAAEGTGFIEGELRLTEASTTRIVVVIAGPAGSSDVDPAEQTVVFEPGQTRATFRIGIFQDAAYEGDEQIQVRVVSATGGAEFSTFFGFAIRIIDDDEPPTTADFSGGPGADVFTGGAAGELIAGRGGNDTLFGGFGDDTVDGGEGNDVLNGGFGRNILRGGAGDDRLIFTEQGYYDGGPGFDMLDFNTPGRIGATASLSSIREPDGQGRVIVQIEGLIGTFASDDFSGSEVANLLLGLAGDDLLRGFDGADVLEGGPGDDVLDGGSGDDRLDGGEGVDTAAVAGSATDVWTVDLVAGTARSSTGEVDTLIGVEGVSLFSAAGGVIDGTAAANRLFAGGGAVAVNGAGGDDYLFAAAGVLNGGDGADTLSASEFELGRMTIYRFGVPDMFGGAGDDVLRVGFAEGVADGGDGRDRLSLLNTDFAALQRGLSVLSTTVNLARSDAQPFQALRNPVTGAITTTSKIFRNIEDVSTNIGAPVTFLGNATANALGGGFGADRLEGREGDDSLFGDGGDDVLLGDAGNDRVDGATGNDFLLGGAGGDELIGGVGIDLLGGEDGDDRLFGGDGGDNIYGGAGTDGVFGEAGDDYLEGQEGGDYILGGAGRDVAYGGSEVDLLGGEAGDDRLFGGDGGDNLYGGTGTDGLFGEEGDDFADGQEDGDFILGGLGNDRLVGGAGVDLLGGEDGDDRLNGGLDGDNLYGGAGADTVFGEQGNDNLFGQDGDDVLGGGAGADVIEGGAGADRILIFGGDSINGAADRIVGFQSGLDRVDVSLVDADSTVAGDQAFTFRGVQNGPGGAGTMHVGFIPGVGIFLFGYVDADGNADVIIDIGTFGVGAGDLIL